MALLCAGYLLVRFIGWWRSRLLLEPSQSSDRGVSLHCFGASVSSRLCSRSFLQSFFTRQLGGYVLTRTFSAALAWLMPGTEQIAVALESVSGLAFEETAEKSSPRKEHRL